MSNFGTPAKPATEGGGRERSKTASDRWTLRWSRFLGWLVLAWSTFLLIGWILTKSSPGSQVSGLPKFAPLTAFCFLALSVGLLLAANLQRLGDTDGMAWSRLFFGLATGLAVLAPAVHLVQDFFGGSLPIDAFPLQLWISGENLGGARLSGTAAVNFLLLGGALWLARRHRAFAGYQALVIASLVTTFLSLCRFLYGGKPLIALAQMSIPSTLLFLAAGVGILFLCPDQGLMRLLAAPNEAGVMVRRLLVPAVAIPPVVGWLRLEGQHAGLYELEAGTGLFTLSNVLVFGALVWLSAAHLEKAYQRRGFAERRILSQLERLQLLHRITRATAARESPRSIFQVVLDSIESQLPIDFGCVCLLDRATQHLAVCCVAIKSQQVAGGLGLAEHATFPVDPNGLDYALRGHLVYEPETSRIARPFPQRLAAGGYLSVVLAPLQAEDQVFGLLVLARREADSFDSGECEFLRQLSESVALASSQAELKEALQAAYLDLRETQQAVLHQDRMRVMGELASGIAHDINNSVSPAALHLERLLEKDLELSAPSRKRLETVQRAINDVAHTVARMQVLYRRQDHKPRVLIQINPLMLQVLELTRGKWRDTPQERGHVIEVITGLAPDLPPIRGIESELREALTNLVLNAVDAMPEGGLLSLRSFVRRAQKGPGGAPPGPRLMIEVSDSGVGMDEPTQRRCIEPFYTTKGERGSGLGLAMVFGAAERHDADIEIRSEPGQGTTFLLSFPIPEVETDRAPEDQVVVFSTDLKILVVDDDPILRDTLTEILTGDGHRVVAAAGGAIAIENLKDLRPGDAPFDLVLTDLGMPEVDGRRVAAAVKELGSTPVILLTGWGQRMLAERDTPPHVDLVLSKPPRLQELRVAIAQLTRKD